VVTRADWCQKISLRTIRLSIGIDSIKGRNDGEPKQSEAVELVCLTEFPIQIGHLPATVIGCFERTAAVCDQSAMFVIVSHKHW